MNPRLWATLCIFCSASLIAQAPAAMTEARTSPLGFTYGLPIDWDLVDTQRTLPEVKKQQSQSASSDEEKKGIECVQIALTARHGNPASVVVVVGLPFACFGHQMTEKDLPGFALGASQGIEKSFTVSDPVYGTYALGTHSFWIERAHGTVIGHPEGKYTVEITCSLLQNGAVCWMTMASDGADLETFEHGNVTLDGDKSGVLVPPTAFDKKPSS
jgi:hypothetical protein